jgi:hypothetical protein
MTMTSSMNLQRCSRVLCCVLALLTAVTMCAQGAPAAQAGGSGLVGMLSQKLHVTPAQAQAGAGAIFGYAKQRMSPAQFQKISSVVPGMDQMLGAAPAAGNAAGSAQSAQPQSQGEAAGTAKTESNAPSSALGQITGGAADASKAAGTTAADASKTAGEAAAGAASGAAGAAGAGGGLMSLGSQFQSIGLSPDMATKFAPVMQQYLSSKGGPSVASSFGSAVGLGGGQ